MIRVSSIVEGFGEVAALPVLLRRLCAWRTPQAGIDVEHPLRVHRDRFLNRDQEFNRYLQLAGHKCGDRGWVLVILDADDDCPATKGPELLARAQKILPHRSVSLVLANREFESWFIGAAASLGGCRGLQIGAADINIEPEVPRDAKGWLRARMTSGVYGETTDQPAFAAHMDLQQALNRCRSFRKFCAEWDKHVSAVEQA